MPRPPRLRWTGHGTTAIGLAPVLVAFLAGPGPAMECGPELALTGAADRATELVLSLDAFCAPYAPVRLTYGPVVLREELSDTGTLRLSLPRLPGIDGLSAEIDGQTLSAAVPPGPVAAPSFAAINWGDSARRGRLEAAEIRRLGFRASDGAAHLDLAIGAQTALIVPVTEDTCGTTVTLDAALPGRDGPVPLVLAMPDCGEAGGSLRLPLP